MGLFSSKKEDSYSRNDNSLKSAMEEGLSKAYRFTSDSDCINDAVDFLSTFTSTKGAPREIMMFSAASSVGGIRDSEARECLMGILERCSKLSPDECLELTEGEKAVLRKRMR